MSTNVARLRRPVSSPASFLGPATVTGAGASTVEVALPDGTTAEARVALAFAYEPVVGDTVLVIGGDEHYVIGVLAAQGKAVLSFPGDLEVRAAGGELRLTGDRGVSIGGPSLQVQVGKLELVARAVTQRFDTLRQRVTELLSVHAGQSHTVVDGTSHTRAESASILTKENVTINGKAIHLG